MAWLCAGEVAKIDGDGAAQQLHLDDAALVLALLEFGERGSPTPAAPP